MKALKITVACFVVAIVAAAVTEGADKQVARAPDVAEQPHAAEELFYLGDSTRIEYLRRLGLGVRHRLEVGKAFRDAYRTAKYQQCRISTGKIRIYLDKTLNFPALTPQELNRISDEFRASLSDFHFLSASKRKTLVSWQRLEIEKDLGYAFKITLRKMPADVMANSKAESLASLSLWDHRQSGKALALLHQQGYSFEMERIVDSALMTLSKVSVEMAAPGYRYDFLTITTQ